MEAVRIGVGSQLGAYRLERRLGAGSTSEVYLGVHVEIGRRVAVKVLAPELSRDEDIFARFSEEARIVNAVESEHIVQIYDVLRTEAPRLVAFVMELVEGPSLKALAPYLLSPAQSLGVALQLVSALGAAHGAGIVHRDLKPENLLFTKDPRGEPESVVPRLKVIDFGIAKQTGGPSRTAVGQMLGTPTYMAPEQISGDPPSSTASDVFALATICYEMWTGSRAYPQPTTPEVVRAKLRGERPRFERSSLPSAAHARAKDLLMAALETDPGDRPSLADVRRGLLAVAGLLSSGEVPAPRGPKVDATFPSSIPAGDTEQLPLPGRPKIPLAETAPSAHSALADQPTEEALPIVTEAPTVHAMDSIDEPFEEPPLPIRIGAQDTLLASPRAPKQESYESLAALLHDVPPELSAAVRPRTHDELAQLATAHEPWPDPRPADPVVRTPERSPIPLPELPRVVVVPRPPKKKKSPWGVALLLIFVAVGVLVAVVLTRPS